MAAAHAAAEICRPSGALWCCYAVTWGSRPRLVICRASGAHHSAMRDEAGRGLRGLTPQAHHLSPLRGSHGHPVCLDRDVAVGIVEGRFPGPTLREVLREVGAVDVEVDDPGVVANCNTPEALKKALGL